MTFRRLTHFYTLDLTRSFIQFVYSSRAAVISFNFELTQVNCLISSLSQPCFDQCGGRNCGGVTVRATTVGLSLWGGGCNCEDRNCGAITVGWDSNCGGCN